MNVWDLIILLAVAACVFFAVRHVRKTKGGCSGCCESCGLACSQKERKTL